MSTTARILLISLMVVVLVIIVISHHSSLHNLSRLVGTPAAVDLHVDLGLVPVPPLQSELEIRRTALAFPTVPRKWEVSTLRRFKHNASSPNCDHSHATIAIITINIGFYGKLNTTASLRNREFAQSRCQMYDLFQITQLPQFDALIAYTNQPGKLGKYLATEALLDLYDTILYLDADATVRATAPGCPDLRDFVTPLLRHRPNVSVFFDSFGNINTSSSSASSSVLDFLNTGAFVMRATPWTRTFLRQIMLQSSKSQQNPLMRLDGITKSVEGRPGYQDTFDQHVIIDLLSQMPFGEVDCYVHFTRPTLSSLFAWTPVHDDAVVLHAVGVQPAPNQTDVLLYTLATSAISC